LALFLVVVSRVQCTQKSFKRYAHIYAMWALFSVI
jgi:hypothetical protein